jgi:hypothetical protein
LESGGIEEATEVPAHDGSAFPERSRESVILSGLMVPRSRLTKREKGGEEGGWLAGDGKERHGETHVGMKLCEAAAIAVNRFGLLGCGRIQALDLDRTNHDGVAHRLRGDKVEAVVSLGKVEMPASVGEQAGDIQFGKEVAVETGAGICAVILAREREGNA